MMCHKLSCFLWMVSDLGLCVQCTTLLRQTLMATVRPCAAKGSHGCGMMWQPLLVVPLARSACHTLYACTTVHHLASGYAFGHSDWPLTAI